MEEIHSSHMLVIFPLSSQGRRIFHCAVMEENFP
jgi:hypothetical protein